ncbi:type IV pili twitching motility protein PilT [Nibricoccus aquaticus]|uniref:Type IV pili twitching motility protein PilT n=1 Tax=Nibricoccus aquaticus TaxID=2576891 RepID=A0A290Q8H9_9BACT|nr:PilT/PilU family type 4a pilus ATPase [Nibricoccus aquaticus]ATC63480.1 type IV pili twitching motility protein PilT [Nibricoccus aquaticus]
MTNEIRWLVRLLAEQGLATRSQSMVALETLGADPQLMDFAQKLIDDAIVEDLDQLERLAADAHTRGQSGPPPSADGQIRNSSATTPAIPLSGVSTPPMPTSPPPAFDFAAVSALDNTALAERVGKLLRESAAYGASDLHLTAGAPPFIRKHREIVPLSSAPLPQEDALRLNTVLLAPHQRQIFTERRDFDYALALDATNRYRVNLMIHKAGAAGAYRMVPAKIPKLDDLGLRNIDTVRKLLSYHNGLILVTGPVGAGKTTTLAALVAELNEQRQDHIITVEDPIEVVQPPRGCNVTQREVGPHTKSFASALKGALREDPDVIVIGELRDLETIEMAITAAETGHLVIGTMHTSDAATTLNRLLDVFPAAQQSQIRASVAESLRGIICQRLLPGRKGGLVLACELLVGNTAISSLIRDGKIQGLRNTMETGLKDGMCLMESVVFELWQQKKISTDTAKANITNRVLRAKLT